MFDVRRISCNVLLSNMFIVSEERAVSQITVSDDIQISTRFFKIVDEGIHLLYCTVSVVHTWGYLPNNDLDSTMHVLQFCDNVSYGTKHLICFTPVQVVASYRYQEIFEFGVFH